MQAPPSFACGAGREPREGSRSGPFGPSEAQPAPPPAPLSAQDIFRIYDACLEDATGAFERAVLALIRAGRFVVRERFHRSVLEVVLPLGATEAGFVREHFSVLAVQGAEAEAGAEAEPRAAQLRKVSIATTGHAVFREALKEALLPCFEALMAACRAKAMAAECKLGKRESLFGTPVRTMSVEFTPQELRAMLLGPEGEAGGAMPALLRPRSHACTALQLACENANGGVSVEYDGPDSPLRAILLS
jgi:hypothetical protein